MFRSFKTRKGLVTDRGVWGFTKHAQAKMRFYNLSESRVRRVLNSPKRKEEGIAPQTIAMMQSAGSQKHPSEIWVMIAAPSRSAAGAKNRKNARKIISAWRYPGRTKPGEPLPEAILKEIRLI